MGRGLLAAALLAAVLIGSRGIRDEGAVSLGGDMPRYLMNGVFLYDFVGSGTAWTRDSALTYAQRYFTQYPALSLGHHPPLLPVSLVPFYAAFGVSVFSARLALLAFFVLSVVLLYTLARREYDEAVAGWACLLFASSPFIATFAQKVLSEMPTIAIVLAAMNALTRFKESGRTRGYLLFGVLAMLSLTARQLAIFMFPAYAIVLVSDGGYSRFARRDLIGWTVAGAVLVASIAIGTLILSPFNVAAVRSVFNHGAGIRAWRAILASIVGVQLTPSLLLVTIAGLLTAFMRRDRRIGTSVYWVLSVLAGVLLVTGPIEPARYSILAVPAYCICAASLASVTMSRGVRWSVTVMLLFAVLLQLWAGRSTHPARTPAYEQAAQFVLADESSDLHPTALYSPFVDTGYFIFFVRKHDSARRLVVLRSDKILTTSLMGKLSVEDRIHRPDEIYPLLTRYGTKFIVIEDRPTGSVVLEWLREELQGPRFIERLRIPFGAEESHVRDSSLVVYEYKNATPPDPDAEIDLKIPLVGREIRVRLSDLRPVTPQ